MVFQRTIRLLTMAFTCLFLNLYGDGFISIDIKVPTKEPARLNIKYHRVTVNIDNQVATTKVDQIFENSYEDSFEGTYIFPIPEQANISKFTLYVNGEPVQAKLFDKAEARSLFESRASSYKDPALLEYVGRGMFQARIKSIPARGEGDVRIALEYSELLTANQGTVKYYYTLSTEKFSAQPLDDVSIKMNIRSSAPMRNIYSPTHTIDVQNLSETQATVTYAERNVRPNQDFILYYTLPTDEVAFNVLTYKDGAEDGFFLAMMSPNVLKKSQPVVAKNIQFVVDTSGSMSGQKIKQAQEALIFCLNRLSPEDNFNIISFNSDVQLYQSKMVNATQTNVKDAVTFAQGLQAEGGTDINTALLAALKQPVANDHPTMIVFLTDGQPTVGEQNIVRIGDNIKRANTATTRLFVFGVGYDVNTALLDKLSLDNKGASDYIAPDENIEAKVSQLYLKVAHPVLTDIKLTFAGTTVKEIYPVYYPDLFVGSQLMVIGRYTNGGRVDLTLSGTQNGTVKQFVFNTNFVANATENGFLPRIWAGRAIAHLVDQIVLYGRSEELVKQIVSLSKRYGIITEYTSYLVDRDVEMMDQYDMESLSLKSLSSASSVQSGYDAFSRAKSQQTLRSSMNASSLCDESVVRPEAQERIRTVGARTFYQKDDGWVDADFANAGPNVVKVKLFSKTYFDLLDKMPELRLYVALGKKVMIKLPHGGVVIDDGVEDHDDPSFLAMLKK